MLASLTWFSSRYYLVEGGLFQPAAPSEQSLGGMLGSRDKQPALSLSLLFLLPLSSSSSSLLSRAEVEHNREESSDPQDDQAQVLQITENTQQSEVLEHTAE